jgi:hypothetical protein
MLITYLTFPGIANNPLSIRLWFFQDDIATNDLFQSPTKKPATAGFFVEARGYYRNFVTPINLDAPSDHFRVIDERPVSS